MINDLYEKWDNGSTIEKDFIQGYDKLPEFLDKLYSKLKIDLNKDIKPYEAYFSIIKINNFVNSILQGRPDIIDTIGHWFEHKKRIRRLYLKK